MFTALTLSMALGAPVPADTPPVSTGVAPRVMELKPGADGKIVVAIVRTEMQKIQLAVANAAGAPPAPVEREVPVTKTMTVPLGEVKDLTITTADGKKLEKEEALKKLEKGGIVVVSADGQPVSPAFLKVFKDDTLVLTAKELVTPFGGAIGRPAVRPLPAIQPGVQILPIQPGNFQIQPGVIQIQVQPGNVQVLPAPVPVEKVPVKPEK